MTRLVHARALFLLSCLSSLGLACSGAPAADGEADVAPTANALSLAAPTTIVGRVTVARSSPLRGAGASTTQIVIRDASRASYVLSADPSLVTALGGASAMAGRRVRATGTLTGGTLTATSLAFDTASVAVVAPPAVRATPFSAGATPTKVVTLACRFSGTTDVSPASESASFFSNALDATAPHLGDYFSKVSRGRVALDGATVIGAADGGWIAIGPSTSYADGSGGFRIADIADDCLVNASVEQGDALTTALESASIVSIVLSHNLVANRVFGLNQALGDLGLGDRAVPLAMLPPYSFRQQSGFAKSIAFALGMGESTTGSLDPTVSPPADSPWDLMSAGGTCASLDPVLGCVAPRPLAAHLDQIGWIDPSEKIDVSSGDHTVSIVAPSSSASGTRLVTVPVATNRYLAIEARSASPDDYDANLPGSAVLVHDVVRRTSAADSPFVAHLDVALSPGGSYTDPATGAVITVLALGTASATVRVLHDVALTVSANTGGAFSIDGTAYRGAATISERPNAAARITLSPDAHYKAAFTGGCTSMEGATCVVQMDQARAVTAQFTYVPPTTGGSGGGGSCGPGAHDCGDGVCVKAPRVCP